ncbi:MAG: dihydroorotate dehydrogenase [Patescibacteria group bacterium]|nr:dihydroorotate dehydrogenase [Patescibacteria group bacterium]
MSQHGYQKIVKPLLFSQPPDAVHSKLLRYGASLQKVALIRSIARSSWAYKNDAYLAQQLNGITYPNPVGLAAGFDKNFELVDIMKSIGFGFMEGGSVTFRPSEGNPRPWFHRLPNSKSLVVNAGLANEGVEVITDRVLTYSNATYTNFPINISVAKTNAQEAASESDAIHDYIGSLRYISKSRIGEIITLNISCPNAYGGEPFTTPSKLDRLLTAVDQIEMAQPIYIKMPSQLPWDEFNALLDVANNHKVAGVTISNLVKDRGAAKLLDPLADTVKGNLSGKPTFDISNQLIRQTYQTYGKRFVIVGVGGIFSAEDAYTKIKLGASLVELITGLIFEGPQLVGQINKGMVSLLKKDGYKNISEAVGSKASQRAPSKI